MQLGVQLLQLLVGAQPGAVGRDLLPAELAVAGVTGELVPPPLLLRPTDGAHRAPPPAGRGVERHVVSVRCALSLCVSVLWEL